MAESNTTRIRAVAWAELFPWLSIVQAFRLAISLRALVLGAAGILLTVLIWGVIGMAFGTDPSDTKAPPADALVTGWLQPYTANPWSELTKWVPERPGLSLTPVPRATSSPVVRSWRFLSSPALK